MYDRAHLRGNTQKVEPIQFGGAGACKRCEASRLAPKFRPGVAVSPPSSPPQRRPGHLQRASVRVERSDCWRQLGAHQSPRTSTNPMRRGGTFAAWLAQSQRETCCDSGYLLVTTDLRRHPHDCREATPCHRSTTRALPRGSSSLCWSGRSGAELWHVLQDSKTST